MVDNWIFGFADSLKIHVCGILGWGGPRTSTWVRNSRNIQLMKQFIPEILTFCM